jgi:hypothetical protein
MDHVLIGNLLNGGYIEQHELDMRNDRLTMRVDVLDGGSLSSYDLRFEKVSYVLFENESNRKDDRLQFTEIGFKETPGVSSSEEWTVIVSMWDTTHLTIRCSAIEVDGDRVR